MTTTPAMPSRNSFWKAMLLAVIAASIVAVLQATSGKNAEAAGYATGYFAAPPIFAGLAVGIRAKLAKSPWSWVSYICGLVAGTLAGPVLSLVGDGLTRKTAQVLEDTMEWSPAAHEYRFALMSQSMYLRARCLSSMTTGTSSYILCIETVSADPQGLNEARAGVRLASSK